MTHGTFLLNHKPTYEDGIHPFFGRIWGSFEELVHIFYDLGKADGPHIILYIILGAFFGCLTELGGILRSPVIKFN